ncbi:PREDICTED: uromodulin-like isoform X4 [Acropora digitifera]|uniref:uromodulin-like isoform X4 n=1 Tax=Acropora digitifera TaxID=70779 RepID=UPI00077ADDB5|nr:PREDICTED: uromodulin-like isoform X4 [Acropora digitifera]
MENFTFKAHRRALLFALVIASIYAFGYAVTENSAQKEDGMAGGSRHINFIEDKFSYLNITVVSRRFVERSLQCALMCLETLPCFSFNLAAFPDNNDKLLCEHLPSDKYNNSEKLIPSNAFHHFSIWSPCSAVVCGNNGKCEALYKENSYVCLCKEGFTGRNCETVVPECASYITLNASDRSVHFPRGKKCDINLTTEWYRFQGQAGKQLAVKCPPHQRCNTDYTGWMNGKHPNVEDGIVKRQVCFHGRYQCCYKTTTIDVRNCGAYFVYRLRKVPTCRPRYCGTG